MNNSSIRLEYRVRNVRYKLHETLISCSRKTHENINGKYNLYSRAKKSVPLLIFVKIGTKVDLIIPNSMIAFV